MFIFSVLITSSLVSIHGQMRKKNLQFFIWCPMVRSFLHQLQSDMDWNGNVLTCSGQVATFVGHHVRSQCSPARTLCSRPPSSASLACTVWPALAQGTHPGSTSAEAAALHKAPVPSSTSTCAALLTFRNCASALADRCCSAYRRRGSWS